ncbi:nuclear transport factor 2 family protein [Gramella sp. KN1008]|uniref:nuclear transport factor 2 family protein n=1 Tax=Gramella sp. KN1008 TaxID=2529298 RepID=UPI00103A514B|nr:nuclear transport factor 2 family protein [Gramella sp. KN1008]TBW27906.1 hypothetical protein EZJ28_09215 [Gramella sp. KN1008]
MKKIVFLSFFLSGLFLFPALNAQIKNTEQNILSAKRNIIKNLDAWHKAAAKANFEDYFELMTDDAVFIGTDPTENWSLKEFKDFARPYFEAGKAWNFTAIERNVYHQENHRVAWFDELLDTQMGICRGSGVMVKENGKWKIQHYVLSITIPNENVDQITIIKKDFDEELISRLRNN